MSVRDDWPVAALLDRGIRLHRSTVTVIDRDEGYREFHCVPPWFSQDPDHAGPVLTEVVDPRWGDDPDGYGLKSDMWSASVASLRLRTTPADRLELRERHVLASRTVTGLNLPPGWLSNLPPRQQGEPTPASPRRGSMWDQLGMVTFIGHSHLCKSFALTRDEVFEVVATKFVIRPEHRYIISVGSVGQPRDYDNRASYTIYDTEERVFEFKRVAYDIDGAAQKIFAADLERNFGNRLFLGV